MTLEDLEQEAEAECSGEPTWDFQRILDSVPIPELVDDIKSQLSCCNTVKLKFKPGELQVKVVDANGSTEEYGVEWEHTRQCRAPAVPVRLDPSER